MLPDLLIASSLKYPKEEYLHVQLLKPNVSRNDKTKIDLS